MRTLKMMVFFIVAVCLPLLAAGDSADSKTTSFDQQQAQSIVLKKLKAFGDLKAYGFTDEYYSKIKHGIIGHFPAPKALGDQVWIVAYSGPSGGNECHACSPKLSFFVFEKSGGQWQLKESYLNAFFMGAWGEAPAKESYRMVQLGKGQVGLLLNTSGMGQGYVEESSKIFISRDNKLIEVLDAWVGSDNEGTGKPEKTSWKAALRIKASEKAMYDIVLHRTGIEKDKKVDENITYRFDGKKYVKVP